jgi:serine/threonine-protein kinase
MEVIEGRSLKELIITRGALPIGVAITYAKQLLEALRFAHRHGIIHRDIKPHNVLVSADQHAKANETRVKVTDFGIARAGPSQMTEAGSIMGTAQYLSPEQARSAPVTAASDLYSAGVVLYEMLTGKVPFTGDSAIEIAMKHVNELPAAPSTLRPEIPPDLDQIVLRALAKDPDERYQTAEDFIEDLERFEAGLPIARATSAAATAVLAGAALGEATELIGESPTRVVAPPPPSAARRPPGYPPASPYDEPPRRRRRWVPWVLVALLIVGAVLAGWWAYNQIQDQLDESAPVGVPLVEGLERDLAIERIEDAGLEAEVEEEPSTEFDADIVMEQSPREGTQVSRGSTVTITVSTGPRQVEVPRLAGLTYDEAVDVLDELGLDARRAEVFSQKPVGQVTGQDPKAGEIVDEGTEIEVRVSKGVREIEVPSVIGQSESSATTELEDADFVVTVTEAPSDDVPEGLVSAQSPSAGSQAPRGSTVQITISTGPQLVNVPDVVGAPVDDARAILQDDGFQPRTVFQDVTDPLQDGIVLDQDPGGGSQASPGSRVTIVVGRLL